MGKRQAPWNKYEAAILLQGFLWTLKGNMPRVTAIQEVSALLRRMAQNAGVEIDDTYRNINGITFQMHSMESAYFRETRLKPATSLFRDIVALDYDSFQQLLLDAYHMIFAANGNIEIGGFSEMAKKVITAEVLQATLSKLAPYGSIGVSAEEMASTLHAPLYKVKYILDSADWVKYDGKYYTLAENINIPPSSAIGEDDSHKEKQEISQEKLKQVMYRVAGSKTKGVSTSYLSFALKCTEEDVLDLIGQSDWIEKIGEMYRCKPVAEVLKTFANITTPSKVPSPNEKKNISEQLLRRLEHIMSTFAPHTSSGVTKDYLAFSLNYPNDKIPELINQVDWIETVNDRYRMRDIPIKAKTNDDVQLERKKKEEPIKASKSQAITVNQKTPLADTKEDTGKAEARINKSNPRTSSEKKDNFDEDNFSDYIRTSEDGELFNRYPVLFKRVFAVMKTSSEAYSIGRVYDATKRISRIEAISEILTGVSWARKEGVLFSFIPRNAESKERKVDNAGIALNQTLNDGKPLVVDFENISDLSFSKPASYQYFEIQRTGFSSWKDLYADFMGCYYEDYPHLLYHGATFSTKDGARADIVDKDKKDALIAPKGIPGSTLCVETNFDASDIVRRMKRLLDMGNLDYDNLTISYFPKHETQAEGQVEAKSAVSTGKTPTVTGGSVFAIADEKEEFRQWLRDKNTVEINIKNFVLALELVESYAKEYRCDHTQFFGYDPVETKLAYNEIMANAKFTKFNEKKGFIFSRAIRKYMVFQRERQSRLPEQLENPNSIDKPAEKPVLEGRNTPNEVIPKPVEEIHTLLLEDYSNGFRLNSSLEMKKFKKKYEAKYGAIPSMTDDQIIWTIQKCGIVHDNRVYLPEKMLDEDTKSKLEVYIKDSFQSGKKCLFYEALFSVFSEQFLDHNIYNADMLKVYLQSVYRGKFYFFNNYFSTDRNATSDPTEEIRNCMVEYGKPIAYDELFKLLPHIPDDKIRFTLNTTKEFISNGRKQYFHINVFQISDDELNDIAGIIQLLIQQNKYISGNELIAAIRAKLPYVLEANAEIADIGVRNALAQLLDSKFSFKGNIISALGVEIEMRDVFSEFSKNTPSFTIDELSKLASDLNTTIYFDYVYKNAVRISQDNFVRKEMVSFDTPQIDQVLDTFCPGRYISVQDITNFVAFPDCGYPWNSFLLESYVAMHSKRYCLLHNTFGVKSVSGGIVKRSSGINSMDMLVTLVLADSNCQLKKEAALEYLYDYGYLGMKRYSTIEQVLIDAQTIRNKRGM